MELVFSEEQIAIVRKAMEEVAKHYEREYGIKIIAINDTLDSFEITRLCSNLYDSLAGDVRDEELSIKRFKDFVKWHNSKEQQQ